jgi:hypothetical protein
MHNNLINIFNIIYLINKIIFSVDLSSYRREYRVFVIDYIDDINKKQNYT